MRVPNLVLRYLKQKLVPLIVAEPDEIIGHNARSRKRDGHPYPVDRPFLLRWFVIPKNRWCNIYLHCFVRDDEDRALHDHPWFNISCLLIGHYVEVTGVYDGDGHVIGYRRNMYSQGDLKFRWPGAAHRVELLKPVGHHRRTRALRKRGLPCWSLFITGPVVRRWGFQCPTGWISSSEFHNKRGCND